MPNYRIEEDIFIGGVNFNGEIIIGSQKFIESQGISQYTEVFDAQEIIERKAREKRNALLAETDWIVPVTDHPDHAAYMTYRQELRDWPASMNFPDVFPTLAE